MCLSCGKDIYSIKALKRNKKKKTLSRRSFLSTTSKVGLTGLAIGKVVYAQNLVEGMDLIGLNNAEFPSGKSNQLSVLNDRPWNIETPAHLLDDSITPNKLFFVRNNGIPPTKVDEKNWKLIIEGESVEKNRSYSIDELKQKFRTYSYHLTLECGGNGRHEFYPPAKGNQWTTGAVGCAKWTGVRLKDVLNDCGLKEDAVYIGYYGKDKHLSGDQQKVVISRGVPIQKALQDESLIAWAMNDKPLPLMNGFPLRLVFGGWPASTSGKWLTKISVRNKVHDGPKMGGKSYRIPCHPVEPGTKVSDDEMCIIESMPVKSLITYPKTGAMVSKNSQIELRGHAWAGELEVSKMEISYDFGATWKKCELQPPINRLAWQQWKCQISLKETGYYEIWARATDSHGKRQPMIVPGWNPKGYLNNATHRIALKVTA